MKASDRDLIDWLRAKIDILREEEAKAVNHPHDYCSSGCPCTQNNELQFEVHNMERIVNKLEEFLA